MDVHNGNVIDSEIARNLAIFIRWIMKLCCTDLADVWKKINMMCASGEIPGATTLNRYAVKEEIIAYCESTKCNLKITNFGYQDRKLGLLKNKYLDEEQFSAFEELVGDRKKAFYYFKSCKTYRNRPKPNCLICLLYDNTKDEYTVVWRTTELMARFAADLIFLSELLEDKKIKLAILDCYQFLEISYGIFKINGLRPKKPDNKKYIDAVNNSRNRFFLESSELYELWQPIKLVQQSYRKYMKRKKEG